jgi:hypothetical protein
MEPLFCVETAVKLLTFSWAMYTNNSPRAAADEEKPDILASEEKEYMSRNDAKSESLQEDPVSDTAKGPSVDKPHNQAKGSEKDNAGMSLSKGCQNHSQALTGSNRKVDEAILDMVRMEKTAVEKKQVRFASLRSRLIDEVSFPVRQLCPSTKWATSLRGLQPAIAFSSLAMGISKLCTI